MTSRDSLRAIPGLEPGDHSCCLYETEEERRALLTAYMRQDYKSLALHRRGQSQEAVTVSLGVAVFSEHGSTASALLRAADAALYCAKAEGRDRVVVGQALEEKAHVAAGYDGRNL